MKSFAAVFALIFAFAAAEFTCDVYSCAKLEGDICARVNQTDSRLYFEFQTCPESKVCDLHLGTEPDHCNAFYTTPSKYPGEYAANETECFGGIYDKEKKICLGKKLNDTCSGDIDCGPKLFCSSQICVPALKEGEACGAAAKCDAHLVCNKGNCTKVGSLKEDIEASAPAACKSFYIMNGRCHEGPKLLTSNGKKAEEPIECPGDCTYTLNGTNHSSSCICGKTEFGRPFCTPGKGDVDITDVIFV